MKETPRVVVNRTRRVETVTPAGPREFSFTADQIRLAGVSPVLSAYRQNAWDSFQSTPLPTVKEDAWRRTDIKGLMVDTFRLPGAEAYMDLPEPPENLLRPLVGAEHGGQVLIMPGGAKVYLAAELTAKGVILPTCALPSRLTLKFSIGWWVKPSGPAMASLPLWPALWPKMG